MKAIGYLRVSTSDQAENGASLAAQRRAIESACLERGHRLVRVAEEVASGGSLRRPLLPQVLTDLAVGRADILVTTRLDRLSRSVLDFSNLVTKAKKQGWQMIVLDCGIDMTTPHGELVANVLVSVAQWERQMISARTKEAMHEKMRQGARYGNKPMVPAPLRKEIRRLYYEDGLSYRGICALLNEEGVPTPGGGKKWQPSSLIATIRKSPPPSDSRSDLYDDDTRMKEAL